MRGMRWQDGAALLMSAVIDSDGKLSISRRVDAVPSRIHDLKVDSQTHDRARMRYDCFGT